MIITSSYQELIDAKRAIAAFKATKPEEYRQFQRIIHLTRQLQFNFQYMGCLIMGEDSSKYRPQVNDDYILTVYNREVGKLKADPKAKDIKALLSAYKQIGYGKLCELILGKKPISLVGPAVV
ncbi:hypothetical protein J32TS6_24510 [Virgibacillus pantothenticus]|uniref:Uncharacterized protein n=1 Tax=Virgibacillus pantothenticus TaxID=1473 RepID=A0A0L0QS16_VIRPA|nr:MULTISPECIES: hypothetical protein [Virgibacillus]API92012.1 hypothetical protein BKP57_09325 [Virgibacillus sp. 6R]KNE21357.1 hypothetical protein AFK71_06715 [Virgibacillus pantothenticus]MBS7430474.1 hypothetical protein [Virgibacillus sp. 19R1-5]MBU8566412.1 hypothetical protein [Virgibacillus pantothenticus]MBU8600173.1 hypothetical protein [Virgibacillus pantothenticus]